jgi:hypothetical protein
MSEPTLKEEIQTHLYLLAERLHEIYPRNPSDDYAAEYLLAPDDFPAADEDADVNYVHGWLQGVADTLHMTVTELLYATKGNPNDA